MIIDFDKVRLAEIAKSFGLKFIILHGSFASGLQDKESDLDIAALTEKPLDFRAEQNLRFELEGVFKLSPQTEMDFKTLNKVDPFFRYQVVKDGILLFGDKTDYEDYKAFASRAFEDGRPLLKLEHYLAQKFQKHLNTQYVK